ncbi:MAG: SurA N-terminal domain-containing protein [Nitrospiria bacterium]
MLKKIREGAIDNPWFFRMLMLGIALVFAVSMGWWGFGGERQENIVATVGEDQITLEYYQQTYRRVSRFYRELFQDEYDDQKVRRDVIDGLVDNKLWAQEAKRMGIFVSDGVLKEAFMKAAAFQTDGAFDPNRYKRFLSNQKLSPTTFEEQQREGLLIEKAKLIIKDGVSMTPMELEGIRESDPSAADFDRMIEDRLAKKKERAVMAYTQSLRKRSSILIKEDHL